MKKFLILLFLFLSFNTLSFASLYLNDISLTSISYSGTKQEALSDVFELFGYNFEPGSNTTSINGYNNLLTNLPNSNWVLINHDFSATSSNYKPIFNIYLGYSEDFTEYTAYYTYGYLPGPRPTIAFQSQGTSYNLRVSVSTTYNDYVLYYKNGDYLEYGSNTIFNPNIEFIANGDELSYYTNGFKVNNLTVYYDMTSWVNLGILVNASNYDIVASLGRISDPSSDYHLYETFSYPDVLRIIDKTDVDINSYYLKSGNFYVLTFAFYDNNNYITELTTYYYINGGPSSGDWLVVRSGDKLYQPDEQTNTLNIMNTIQDTYNNLFTLDQDDLNVMLSDFISDNEFSSGEIALATLGFNNLNNSGDFIISWGNINTPYFKLSGDSINFSSFVRNNDTLSQVMNYVHHILGVSLLFLLAHNYYLTFLKTLGVATDVYENSNQEKEAVESVVVNTDSKGRKTTTRTLKSGNITYRWTK